MNFVMRIFVGNKLVHYRSVLFARRMGQKNRTTNFCYPMNVVNRGMFISFKFKVGGPSQCHSDSLTLVCFYP